MNQREKKSVLNNREQLRTIFLTFSHIFTPARVRIYCNLIIVKTTNRFEKAVIDDSR